MSVMRFDELSTYFQALCAGEIAPKFLPYGGKLPSRPLRLVSFKGNPYPRNFSSPTIVPIHARVLDPHFAD